MLARYLYTPQGKVRTRRMIAVLATTIALAIFGSFLLAFTPSLSGHQGAQTAWVIFSVALLKLPLIGLLWWFIIRNKEWPMKPPRWSAGETREILDYLVAEADRATTLPDAPARLAYLRGEAWHVADRAEGELKVDAIAVALRIDQMVARPSAGRRPLGR
jgi:hypothetical protein